MSKTIKLEDQVYQRLDELRGKRETFSYVVDKLLITKEGVDTMVGIWPGQGAGQQRPPGEDKTDPAAVPGRSSYPLYG